MDFEGKSFNIWILSITDGILENILKGYLVIRAFQAKGGLKNGNMITVICNCILCFCEEPYGYHFPIPTTISLGKPYIIKYSPRLE